MRLPRSSMRLRLRIEVGTELRERRQFAELRQITFDTAGDLFHRFDLRGGTDARHGETDGNGGTNALIEQIGFQINLAVRDRNHVRRNVSRNVARLRFDDRQRGQRTIAVFFADTRAERSSKRLCR